MSIKLAAPVFFDTNVLVYVYDRRDAAKQKAAQRLVHASIAGGMATISSQVVQEFCHVVLTKLPAGLRYEELQQLLQSTFLPLMNHTPSAGFYERALALHGQNSLSWYDALIVQAALDIGCGTLYSEDLQAGQRFGALEIVNPFV